MIKDLITDIAYDNIKLSQALTRAKLIANKIKNDQFKNWISRELEGYNIMDTDLPEYRKIWSPVHLKVEFSFGQKRAFPVLLPDTMDPLIVDTTNFHRVIEPIYIVEQQIGNFTKSTATIVLPPQITDILGNLYEEQINLYGGAVVKAIRDVSKAQYQNIIELTKQKLLDTLMELDNEFPNLTNDYKITKENNEKVHNIVNNHIYGNNNPLNIATGVNINQNIGTITIKAEDEFKLKSLGVEQKEIDELKEIVKSISKDKTTFSTKIFKWIGTVSASMAARSLSEKIPEVIELVQQLNP